MSDISHRIQVGWTEIINAVKSQVMNKKFYEEGQTSLLYCYHAPFHPLTDQNADPVLDPMFILAGESMLNMGAN